MPRSARPLPARHRWTAWPLAVSAAVAAVFGFAVYAFGANHPAKAFRAQFMLIGGVIPGIWIGIRFATLPEYRRTTAEIMTVIIAVSLSVVVAAKVLTAR